MEVAQDSGPAKGWSWVEATPPPSSRSRGTWEDRGIAGKVWRPESGANERHREDNSLLGMPPELVAASAVPVVRAVAGAGASVAAKAGAAASAAATNIAAPQAKYWATKLALGKMGVPPLLTEAAAVAVSGYKKGAKAEPAVSAEPVAASPVEPVPAAPAPQAAPVARTAVPPPTAASAPSVPMAPAAEAPIRMGPDGLLVGRPGGNPDLPNMKALNETRLAEIRASQTPAPAAKPMLLASEAKEYIRLMKQPGMTHTAAMQAIQQQRDLIQALNLTTPTAAETRFPKGMRGGSKERSW